MSGKGVARVAALCCALLAPPSAALAQPKPGSALDGVELWVGSWLLRPTLTAGLYSGFGYDFNEPSRRAAGDQRRDAPTLGLSVQPGLIAERRTGIHDTTLRWQGDARIGTGNADDRNVLDANASLAHRYEIQRDLVMNLSTSFVRSTSTPIALNNLLFNPDLPTDGDGKPVDVPQSQTGKGGFPFREIYSNRLTATATVAKTFNRLFATLGGSVTSTTATDRPDALRGIAMTADGETYDVHGRVGYKISPLLYGFIEPSANFGRYDISRLDTNGQRIVAGIGSERFRLFRGEIFGGYQRQEFELSGRAPTSGGTFGGSITWDPTRDILITVAANRSLGVSTLVSGRGTAGRSFASTSTTASLTGTYALSRKLTLAAALGYSFVEEEGTGREYDIRYAGANLTYFLTHNLVLNAVYQYIEQEESRGGTPGINRLTVGAGVTF
ncbi:MAG TPA: outer membrane beta-barrel protein [Microvirga sp.]|jgi:hypothetical protein|nr:outer membrane beta-barrel protein [Microvirga sp.]